MRRVLLSCFIILALLTGIGLTFFVVSPFRVDGQPLLRSLDDFIYLLRVDRLAVGSDPPPLTEAAYRELLGRIGPRTHKLVQRLVRRQLRLWGKDVEPLLIADLVKNPDAAQLKAVARILGELESVAGGLAIAELLLQLDDDPRETPALRRALLKAIEKSKSQVTVPLLIAYLPQHPELRIEIFAALGGLRQGDFLLEKFQQEPDWGRKDDLIWPLAATRDPQAMQALAPLLLHLDQDIRVRTISALSQSARESAINTCLDILEQTQDEYVYSAVMQSLLAHRYAAGNPRVVPFLQQYLQHPALAWEANYALSRIGSPQAIDALSTLVGTLDPHTVMKNFEYLGTAALPLVEIYLRDDVPYTRRQAIYKLDELLEPVAIPLLQPLLQDPDYRVRKVAAATIRKLEKLQLLKSFTDYLPEAAGQTAWNGFRREMSWGFRAGFDYGISIFTWLHWLGIWVSLGLGLLLMFNLWRVFEPYRFNLFVQFLLVSGFLGDFLFLDNSVSDYGKPYLLGTGCHLLLLIGFFSKENKPLPGQLGNRFARLAGANMALLAPVLLWFGTPVLAAALRQNMVDFGYFWPGLLLLLLSCLLVIEQWALPWKLLRPSARRQRWLSALLSTSILTWIAWPLWQQAQAAAAVGNRDQATFQLLLLLPFGWLLLHHWLTLNPFKRQVRLQLPLPPEPGWQLSCDGERINLLWQPEAKGLFWPLLRLALVCGAGFVAAALAGLYRGGAPGFILSLMIGLAGAALVGLTFEFFRPRILLQIEDGYLRSGIPRLGGTLAASSWSRHLLLAKPVWTWLAWRFDKETEVENPAEDEEVKLGTEIALSGKEIAWLNHLRALSRGEKIVSLTGNVKLAAKMRLAWSTQSREPLLLVQMKLKNGSSQSFSLALLDQQSGTFNWTAELDGIPAELMFYRQEREQPIAAGAVRSLQLRVFPRADWLPVEEPGQLLLKGPAGVRLSLPVPIRAGEVPS